MSRLDELLTPNIKIERTMRDIRQDLMDLHVGDEVLIPVGELREPMGKPAGSKVKAVVYQVCTYHVVFQLQSGVRISIVNSACNNVEITGRSHIDYQPGPYVTLDEIYKSITN